MSVSVYSAQHYGRTRGLIMPSGPETSLQFFNAPDHQPNIKQLVRPQGSKVSLRLLMAELKRRSAGSQAFIRTRAHRD